MLSRKYVFVAVLNKSSRRVWHGRSFCLRNARITLSLTHALSHLLLSFALVATQVRSHFIVLMAISSQQYSPRCLYGGGPHEGIRRLQAIIGSAARCTRAAHLLWQAFPHRVVTIRHSTIGRFHGYFLMCIRVPLGVANADT